MHITRQTREFIRAHRHEDVRAVALAARRCDGLDLPFALDQIAGRRMAQRKLPQWARCDDIVYPPHLAMEQCSSQTTARYKATLARRLVGERDRCDGTDAWGRGACGDRARDGEPCGDAGVGVGGAGDGGADHADSACPPAHAASASSGMGDVRDSPESDGAPVDGAMADLTGGFAVDCSVMAREFRQAVYVEPQKRLCDIAAHNMRVLGLERVRIVNAQAEDFLADLERRGDSLSLAFMDPSRRDGEGRRVAAIRDCAPDALGLHRRLLAVCPMVMVKLSPMLDWRKAVRDFQGAVSEVHIVSVANECKELLLVLRRGRDSQSPVRIVCVNDADVVEYTSPQGRDGDDSAVLAQAAERRAVLAEHQYLYEPNASLMKAGAFAVLARRYGVAPVAVNSHLFVSGDRLEGFPGRGFVIEAVGTMNRRDRSGVIGDLTHANITVRNFPLTVTQLRSRLRLADGGDDYLFATTDRDGRHVLIRARRETLSQRSSSPAVGGT